jgi:hypothetical protein
MVVALQMIADELSPDSGVGVDAAVLERNGVPSALEQHDQLAESSARTACAQLRGQGETYRNFSGTWAYLLTEIVLSRRDFHRNDPPARLASPRPGKNGQDLTPGPEITP